MMAGFAARCAAVALLVSTAACGSGAATGDAAVAVAENAAGSAPTPAAASTPAVRTTAVAVRGATDVVRCPATLASGNALPAGARVVGTPPGNAIALSSATVTADAVAAIAPNLSGLAEVDPEQGPADTGLVTQYQAAEPTADRPYALICRYGAQTLPLLAQAALLVPVPMRDDGGRYRCTTRMPQGNDPRATEASCTPQ